MLGAMSRQQGSLSAFGENFTKRRMRMQPLGSAAAKTTDYLNVFRPRLARAPANAALAQRFVRGYD
jgi:hypothetical protein